MSAAMDIVNKEAQKKKFKGKFATVNEYGFYNKWNQTLLPLVVRSEESAPASISDWDVYDNVQVAFIHQPDGFVRCGTPLSTRVGRLPIRLLIADSDYGIGAEAWDKEPWKDEFLESIDFVVGQNGSLQGATFAWFLTDKQMLHCLQACDERQLNFKLIAWHKPATGIVGQRFRHDAEFIIVAWHGERELDFVTNIDSADPLRYSTVHHQGRLRQNSYQLDEENQKVNLYQKPVSLMKKLINMSCGQDENLIVDITCGTGTTAVSNFPLLYPLSFPSVSS